MKKILIAILAIFAVVAGVSACSITDSDLADPSFQTLRYAGGFGEGSKFKECVDPGKKLASDDHFYRYPTTQREDVWDSDNYNQGSKSADHPDMKITVNGVDLFIKMKVQFFLNTSCKPVKVDGKEYPGGTIQYFHEHIGKTRKAYFNKDGSYGNGWLWAMDNYLSSSVTGLTAPALRKYTPEKAWLDSAVWDDVAAQVKAGLPTSVDNAMESGLTFYQDFTVKVFGIQPEDSFVSLYKERQAAQTKAQTADFNKKAQVIEAEAQAAVQQAQAKVKAAEISGYGDKHTYICAMLAEKGMNCEQPTYVVGGTSVK